MIDKEFIELHNQHFGYMVDALSQLDEIQLTGQELKSFVEHCIDNHKSKQVKQNKIMFDMSKDMNESELDAVIEKLEKEK